MTPSTDTPHLTVVIPAYNEARRLPETLTRLKDYLSGWPYTFEVLVVDDGSTDDTAGTVRRFTTDFPQLTLCGYEVNRGKGAAVRHGAMIACGRHILIYDADGATPIEEIERLWPAILENGADIAIGSRALPFSETKLQAHLHRKILGRIFNALLLGLVLGVHDTQCGFKLFTGAAAQALFSLQTLNGYAFDVEILHAAKRNGFVIQEVAVNWTNIPGSKVNVLTDSWLMLADIARIAWRSLRGGYRVMAPVENIPAAMGKVSSKRARGGKF